MRVCSSLPLFTAEMREIFDHPLQGKEASSRLLSLLQGSSTVSQYSVDFRILEAACGWDERALQGVFVKGLKEELKDELHTKKCWVENNPIWVTQRWYRVGPVQRWVVLDQQGWVMGLTQHVGLRLYTQKWVKNNSAVGFMLSNKWAKIEPCCWVILTNKMG